MQTVESETGLTVIFPVGVQDTETRGRQQQGSKITTDHILFISDSQANSHINDLKAKKLILFICICMQLFQLEKHFVTHLSAFLPDQISFIFLFFYLVLSLNIYDYLTMMSVGGYYLRTIPLAKETKRQKQFNTNNTLLLELYTK